jgi:hypothetical protein
VGNDAFLSVDDAGRLLDEDFADCMDRAADSDVASEPARDADDTVRARLGADTDESLGTISRADDAKTVSGAEDLRDVVLNRAPAR